MHYIAPVRIAAKYIRYYFTESFWIQTFIYIAYGCVDIFF